MEPAPEAEVRRLIRRSIARRVRAGMTFDEAATDLVVFVERRALLSGGVTLAEVDQFAVLVDEVAKEMSKG